MSEPSKAPFEPIPMPGMPEMPEMPKPSFSRSTNPPAAPPVQRKPLLVEDGKPNPFSLPQGIAPEAPAEPAPKPARLPMSWLKPTRTKGVVLAAVASLGIGAFGLNALVPTTVTEPPKANGSTESAALPTNKPAPVQPVPWIDEVRQPIGPPELMPKGVIEQREDHGHRSGSETIKQVDNTTPAVASPVPPPTTPGGAPATPTVAPGAGTGALPAPILVLAPSPAPMVPVPLPSTVEEKLAPPTPDVPSNPKIGDPLPMPTGLGDNSQPLKAVSTEPPPSPFAPAPPKGETLVTPGVTPLPELTLPPVPLANVPKEEPKLPSVVTQPVTVLPVPELTPHKPVDVKPLTHPKVAPTEPTPEPQPFPPPAPTPPADTSRPSAPGTSVSRSVEAKTDYDVDIHKLRSGDTYAKISQKFYGTPTFANALRGYNDNADLGRMRDVQVPPIHVIKTFGTGAGAETPRLLPVGVVQEPAPVIAPKAERDVEWGSPGARKPDPPGPGGVTWR